MNKNMETEYQNLNWAVPIIKQQLNEYPTSKISTIFKLLRNHPRFSLIGDYPLLSAIIMELKIQNIQITKLMVRKTLKHSDELGSRETVLRSLFES